MSSELDTEDELIGVLTHIVAPFGSAIWAAVELVDGAIPMAELGLLVILMGGLFLAFRNTIGMIDKRLNSEVAR